MSKKRAYLLLKHKYTMRAMKKKFLDFINHKVHSSISTASPKLAFFSDFWPVLLVKPGKTKLSDVSFTDVNEEQIWWIKGRRCLLSSCPLLMKSRIVCSTRHCIKFPNLPGLSIAHWAKYKAK